MRILLLCLLLVGCKGPVCRTGAFQHNFSNWGVAAEEGRPVGGNAGLIGGEILLERHCIECGWVQREWTK